MQTHKNKMLNSVSKWFDYIYYRSALFYRGEGHLSPTLVVSVIKAMILLDVYHLILYMLKNMEFIEKNSNGVIGVPTALAIINLIIDYRNYNNKFDAFHEKWKDESKRARIIKGLVVSLTFAMPFLPLIIKGLIST